VESPTDIPADIQSYSTVGLSAGASTPEDLIDQIERALSA
jgi:4-hydroxy-3-methylbut-2-enyl diphosphate reductase IspH